MVYQVRTEVRQAVEAKTVNLRPNLHQHLHLILHRGVIINSLRSQDISTRALGHNLVQIRGLVVQFGMQINSGDMQVASLGVNWWLTPFFGVNANYRYIWNELNGLESKTSGLNTRLILVLE